MTSPPVRFETLIHNHHDEIYSYLWRLLDSSNTSTTPDGAVDAADLTQEVFLRAYQAFKRLRPDSNARAWLYKIATNCAYTALKRARRRAEHSDPLPDEEDAAPADGAPLPDERASQGETLAAVRRQIAALPARQQAAVLMRYAQGLRYDEIAQALNCSPDSARAHVYQALRRLRQTLAPKEKM
jgi:RNA polymerase sigma-70 factor (ECF subfamily)